MNEATIQIQTIPVREMNDGNFAYCTADLAAKMKVKNPMRLQGAIKSAIEECKEIGIPVDLNFKPVYSSDSRDIAQDWKLSILAYWFSAKNL